MAENKWLSLGSLRYPPYYVEHAKELSSSPHVPGALFGGRGAKHRQLEQMLEDLWSK